MRSNYDSYTSLFSIKFHTSDMVEREVLEARRGAESLNCDSFIRSFIGRAESEGRGGSFSACCLTALRTVKIPGSATFQESLIAFEQIPAIPAKFREICIEKHAI